MGRRKSDRLKHRIVILMAACMLAQSLLCSYIGYRALRVSLLAIETLDTYNELMREMVQRRHASPRPLGF